jgi:DNA-binding MarR family transcriptional regulator
MIGYAGRVDRADLEGQIAADVRALTAASEQIGHAFAVRHGLTTNDFRALLHVMVADTAGVPLTAGELSRRMGMSGAAITYLVERMLASGHLERHSDPADRRKVVLRVAEHGMAVAKGFFAPLARHQHDAMAELSDRDLAAAHRALAAVVAALQSFAAELDG